MQANISIINKLHRGLLIIDIFACMDVLSLSAVRAVDVCITAINRSTGVEWTAGDL